MNFSFEKVGPYLKDPLILIGFFLLLAFGLFRLVIKKGLIPKLQQKHGYEVIKLILWFAFIIGVLLIVLGFPLKRQELLNQPQTRNSPDQPFLIDLEAVWPMLIERKHLGFWVAYESKHGNTLSPVHLGLYVRFVNLQSKPLSIETLGTEFHQFSGENWSQLFPIHPYGGIFYLPAPDLHQAAPVAFSAGDFFETLRTRQIQPHETVRGWLFYEMAEGFKNCLAPNDCTAMQFRFHLVNSEGSEINMVVDAPKGDFNAIPHAGFDVTGDGKDISGYYITEFSKSRL